MGLLRDSVRARDASRPSALTVVRRPANPTASHCSNRTLGYSVPPDVAALTGQPLTVVNIIVEGLTFILVLHPLAALFSFAALVPGVAALYTWSPHAWGIASLVISFLAAFTASISAAIDVTLVAIAKSRFDALDLGLNIAIDYGPAVWMTVAAAGLLWFEVVCASIVVCDCCGFGIEHEYVAPSSLQRLLIPTSGLDGRQGCTSMSRRSLTVRSDFDMTATRKLDLRSDGQCMCKVDSLALSRSRIHDYSCSYPHEG